MTFVHDEEKEILEAANSKLENINKKLGLSTVEEQYVEDKFKAMVLGWVDDYKQQEKQRIERERIEQNAARVRAEREGTLISDEQRKRIEEQKRANELKRPTEYPCTVCGQTMPHPDMIKHWTSGRTDLCIRKPRLALKQGLITKDQFEMIEDEGKLDAGTVFHGVGSGEGVIQDSKTHESAFEPTKNPLADNERKTVYIKHGGTI